MNKFKFFMISILRCILGCFFNIFIKRSRKYITFWSKIDGKQELFMHNIKYIFLYLNNVENKYNFKINWICNDKKMRKYLNQKGYENVRSSYSLKGMYYALKSKIWLHCFHPMNLDSVLNYNVEFVNLWHGVGGLKKIAKRVFRNKIVNVFYSYFISKDKFFITSGNADKDCIINTIKLPEEKIKLLGCPRLDALFKSIEGEDLFMEDDLNKVKSYKNDDYKIILYVPTHRKNGTDIYNWLRDNELAKILKNNKVILLCKLHFIDQNNNQILNNENMLSLRSNSDLQPILRYCDFIITDYSSVYFDFLLLNRPIIHYIPDLYEYQQTNEYYEFYSKFEDKVAGDIAYNKVELYKSIQNLLNGQDEYKEKREHLIKQTFEYIDDKNCERVIDFLGSLSEY